MLKLKQVALAPEGLPAGVRAENWSTRLTNVLRRTFPTITSNSVNLILSIEQTYRGNCAASVSGKVDMSTVTSVNPAKVIEYTRDIENQKDTYTETGKKAARHTVVVLLNGGAATSVKIPEGWSKAFIPLRPLGGVWTEAELLTPDVLKNIDIIARRVENSTDADETYVIVGTPDTDKVTQEYLQKWYPAAHAKIKFIIQDESLRLDKETLEPADGEKYPIGHGDIPIALHRSGVLEQLDAEKGGIEHILFANSDDVTAWQLRPEILGYWLANNINASMLTTYRTPADIKGGFVAENIQTSSLQLVETAEIDTNKPEDVKKARDAALFPYFNTNSVYMSRAVFNEVNQPEIISKLPVFANEKDMANGRKGLQLEIILGKFFQFIPTATITNVPRQLIFSPFKKWANGIEFISNLYVPIADTAGKVVNFAANPARDKSLEKMVIEPDTKIYNSMEATLSRFPAGLDLLNAAYLGIKGDVYFGQGVKIVGEVELENNGPEQWSLENQTLGKRGLKAIVKPNDVVEYLKWTGQYLDAEKTQKEYRPATPAEIELADNPNLTVRGNVRLGDGFSIQGKGNVVIYNNDPEEKVLEYITLLSYPNANVYVSWQVDGTAFVSRGREP